MFLTVISKNRSPQIFDGLHGEKLIRCCPDQQNSHAAHRVVFFHVSGESFAGRVSPSGPDSTFNLQCNPAPITLEIPVDSPFSSFGLCKTMLSNGRRKPVFGAQATKNY